MHAAVLQQYGTPAYGEFPEPEAGDGQVVVEVAVAGVNPVDVAMAAGRYFTGKPPLPFVPGQEGVGVVAGTQRRVYFDRPVPPHGSMAQRAVALEAALMDVPDGLDDGLAVALGIAGLAAWLPLTWRAQLQAGETVLVLGATGTVGQIAVQAARLLGAARVVAAGRDVAGLERASALGADATVPLADDAGAQELTDAFREAAGGDVDVVIDPLWGVPAVGALGALAVHGRLIQIGQSAGAEAAVPSAFVRGRMAEIRGFVSFLVSDEVRREGYEALAAHAAAGRIQVELERIPLADVQRAWELQQRGAHRKLVLVP